MKILKLLSFKLFFLILIVLAILSSIVSYFQLKSQTEDHTKIISEMGMQVSEIIRGSTRHSMLLNQKEDTYQIIRTIAQQGSIEKIRIYNKRGTIIFSADDSEINETVDMQDEACYMCHKPSGDVIHEPLTKERSRIFTRSDGERYLGFVTAIKNETGCYMSDCHYHNKDETFLGTIDVIISLKETDEIMAAEKYRMISGSIIVALLIALTAGIFIWFFVHIPVHRLILGTKEISSGNLGYKIESKSKDEMGILGTSFNIMSKDLKDAKSEITTWSDQLENRVKEKTKELEQTQKRNIQIEKMASLGQLSATVAHELNNPIAGILTYSKLIQKKLAKEHLTEDEKNTILKNLKMMETESQRSGDIVKNMLLFSRQQVVEMKPKDIRNVIESSIDLISHHLQLHNIELKKYFQVNIPEIYVDENQIKQALLALYVNAVEAMENEGTLTVKTDWKKPNNYLNILISDTGKGISEETKSQIFEPFFTTKNAVKGVGLGLASVYAIVNKHNGEISVESEMEKGTTFIIKLPLKQNR